MSPRLVLKLQTTWEKLIIYTISFWWNIRSWGAWDADISKNGWQLERFNDVREEIYAGYARIGVIDFFPPNIHFLSWKARKTHQSQYIVNRENDEITNK